MPTSLIYWGAGLATPLVLGYPFDNMILGRRPRPGSRRGLAPSGVEDAHIVGRDYILRADIRWVPRDSLNSPVTATPWSGPTGVQAFLDWCADGNSFRFLPDSAYPYAYVDGCYLLEPWLSDFEGHSPELDGTFRLPVVIRHPTVDLGLLARGLLFEYVPGASLTDPVAWAFARASTAYEQNALGTWDQKAAGALRDGEVDAGLRGTLLEPSAVNLVGAPEDLSDVGWARTNITSVTPAATAMPHGTVGNRIQAASAGVDQHFLAWQLSVAAGALAAGVNLVYDNYLYAMVRLWNATDGDIAHATINVQTGAIIAQDGQVPVRVRRGEPLNTIRKNTWDIWRVEIAGDATVADSLIIIQFSDAASNKNVNLAGTEQFYAGDVMVRAGSYAVGSYHATTRARDDLTAPWPFVPGPCWVYVKLVERGGAWHDGGPVAIGLGGGAPSLFFGSSPGAGTMSFYHRNVSSGDVSSSVTYGVTRGDVVELLGILSADGSVQIKLSVNGGAEQAGAVSAGQVFPKASWATAELGLGTRNAGDASAYGAVYVVARVGFQADVTSIAAARAK